MLNRKANLRDKHKAQVEAEKSKKIISEKKDKK